MEEEKAAAYYEELTRKGSGAARFKQGLGFSTSSSAGTTNSNHNDAVPARGSALPSSSSFLSSFVKASSPSKSSDIQKQVQIESIQNKLKKKPNSSSSSRVSDDHHSRGRESDKHSSRRRRSRSRSRSRSRNGDERSRNRRRHRSNSGDRDRYEDRDRYRDRERGRRRRSRSRSRSVSPRRRRSGKSVNDVDDDRKARKEKTGRIDHAKLIEGYDTMSPAERVKAKMKLQLSATAKLDEANGMGSGWERFKFDKDAPLDDEEIEAAEDDGDLARREEKIKATHDEAIFGTSSLAPPVDTDSEAEGNDHARESPETAPAASSNIATRLVA
ncbi:hypothetical protein Ccrd_022876 [Cynara cardunculus var. scolymus]|uniref:Uncharacterized protein n=1 Tax=Cynara cardunculus var. scolymus TaxID=59895 RepID=A0A103XXZ6_CYNCS|nr:hypothetical protein Ccrd_022876 [Cynara cardunculus var. scolymus]